MVYGSQYDDQTGLILRDSDSGDERCLAYPVQRDEQESIAPLSLLPAMSFTPDNKEVVTTWDGKLHRVVTDGGNVNVIPLDVDAELEEYDATLLWPEGSLGQLEIDISSNLMQY